MESQSSANPSQWGFVSTDGFFQPILSLTTQILDYVSKSLPELETMLLENVQLEKYEQCAVIRDEIFKRTRRSDS